jgi:hypothetical protein
MQFTLGSLRDYRRAIEQHIQELVSKVESGTLKECERVKGHIQGIMADHGEAGLALFVKLDAETKTVYLQFEMGNGKYTSRKRHNPIWGKPNLYQPFQQALFDLGYEDIEPGLGKAIPKTYGEIAPGIRITARMGPEVIERIKEG